MDDLAKTQIVDYLIDISDLSRQLKVPEKTIRNKLSDGTWPLEPVRIGRALRWRQSMVERLKAGKLDPISQDAKQGRRR